MAEYYPLLAKAIGSLPNSTPDSRRVVYERARKALIGQLRTMHPPVPDEDIDRESVELDRAIERLETELAAPPATPLPPSAPPGSTPPEETAVPRSPAPPPSPAGALGPVGRKPIAPLRPPTARPARPPARGLVEAGEATDTTAKTASPAADAAETAKDVTPVDEATSATDVTSPKDVTPAQESMPTADQPGGEAGSGRPRIEAQRPIAPTPPVPKGPKRPTWILPAGIVLVVLAVGAAAWKLRVRPEAMTHSTPAATQPVDSGKIADRVGGDKPSNAETPATPDQAPQPDQTPAPARPAPESAPQPSSPPAEVAKRETTPPSINPAVPVAYRAALLVEAPDLPSKVQTFPGTVVWKLNNVNAGPSDAVGLSVEADIDLPQDKVKATVTFERNTDPSLPASHTIKVRFTVDPGSYSGEIKQISVPQMRREGNSDGEPLAGVTVPVIQNSFLVGLSPGNAETANLRLINEMPWVDVPMLLASGRIAKLTFEKGAAGQRDIAEAISYWQKQ